MPDTQPRTPPPEHETQNPEPRVAGVCFQRTGKVYCFDASHFPDLQPRDIVLVETARGQQLGTVVDVRPPRQGEDVASMKPVQRRATSRDLALRREWQKKECEALVVARETVAQLNLPIKIATAEYTFDGQRLTLLYVTEDEKKKLEAGELLQRLQRTLSVRVDLHRVGPRDQAKMMGGYGACGELRCCSRFLSEFSPVSIKMAKTQGVSLNPADITGMCGRLRCCLIYEEEQYKEASQMMPRRKKYVRTPHGEGKVVDLLPLKGVVVVQVEDRRLEVPLEDVEVIS